MARSFPIAVGYTFISLFCYFHLGWSQQEVVIDSYPPVTSVEQGESILLVCRVVGVLPTATPAYSWTCRESTCTGSEVVSNNRLSIGVINNNHQGDFTCAVSGSGVTTQSRTFNLDITDGVVLSAQGSPVLLDRFIPKNSFIEDSSTITSSGFTAVSCRGDNSNPMWYYSNGTVVTTTTTFNVYQNVRSSARSDLMIDTATFINGDYNCTSDIRSTTLGLYLTSGGGTLNPPTNLMSSSVMATSLVVSWTASTSSSVTGYYISWRRTDLGGLAVGEYAQTTGVTYTITNLFSGVPYEISVWSTDGTRVSSPATFRVTTTDMTPSAPRLLRVVDSTSCQLDWLPPASPNGAVTYTVQYQTSSGGSFMDVATGLAVTHHTAVNLPSGTSVTLRVRAINSAGMSDSNTAVLQVPTLPQPVSPTASLTSSNTITVSWTAPTVNCPSIDDYIVVYNDGTGNTSVASTGLTATLSNLQSATTYSLFVAARSNGVAGLSAATSPAMITTLLASPRNFMVTSTTSTAFTLSWSPPAQGTVQYYKLIITGGGGGPATVSPPSTIHMFSSLSPGTQYMVTIAAVDSMGREGELSTTIATTNIGAPSNFMVTTTMSTSITLSWSPPPQGTVQSYRLTITGGGGLATVPSTSTTHMFSSLTPGTQYMITIAAVDSMGREGESTTITVTTNLSVPEPVSSISTPQPESSTSVSLSWIQASNPSSGTVQGYLLTIVRVGAAGNSSNGSVSVDGQSTTTATLTLLVPGTPYFVEVQVRESIRGLGLPRQTGVFFSQETDADPSAQVSGLTLSMDSTRITWNPIALIEAHHFFNYTITYTSIGCGTQKRQTPMMQMIPYSACTAGCSLTLLDIAVDAVYAVTVTITKSTNPGVSVAVPNQLPGTNSPASSCATTGAVSGVVTGVIASILTGTVTAIVMYFIMQRKRTEKYKMRNNETERVYEDPSYTNQGAKDSVEMTSNPAYEKVVM